MKRIALIAGAVVVLLASVAAVAVASGSTARAVIPGCQNVTMNDSTPPFPLSVTWVGTERAHHYGSYRISGGCGQQVTATLLGIGGDSNLRCAGMYLHVQRDDGTVYRTDTVHTCTGQPSVRVAGFLPVNHRFWLHCADSQAPVNMDMPCRVSFRF